MQIAAQVNNAAPPAGMVTPDLDAGVEELLRLPCSVAGTRFAQLCGSTSEFQLALDALLPILRSPGSVPKRILAAYILYALYAPYPLELNPFRDALMEVFQVQQRLKVEGKPEGSSQLVYVTWKILKGDGQEFDQSAPDTLARATLPEGIVISDLKFDGSSSSSVPAALSTSTELSLAPSAGDQELSANSADTSRDLQTGAITSPEAEVTPTDDVAGARVAQALQLALAARERVLTLAEQRTISALLPQLTSPPMITSLDLAPIISHNPTLGGALCVCILSGPPYALALPQKDKAVARIDPQNASKEGCLSVLSDLPPTLPSFDLFGRLLRDDTPVQFGSDANDDRIGGHRFMVGDVIRVYALGAFLQNCIAWIESAAEEERAGNFSDDRVSQSVANLCRFYTALLKLRLIDPSSDADTAAMAHFSLVHSGIAEANALYRTLAGAQS